MPFWPFLMFWTFLCFLAGLAHGKWLAPLIILLAYVATRGAVTAMADPELWVGLIWISTAMLVAWAGMPLVGLALLASGLCYPLFRLFGHEIEYLGALPIASEVFGVTALLLLGGGTFGPLLSSDASEHRPGGASGADSVSLHRSADPKDS